MAATYIFRLGTLDLSGYCRMNPDDKFDPYSPSFVEPSFAETPFADTQVLVSTTVNNREMHAPLFLRDPTGLKDQLHALIQLINNAAAQRPLVVEWRDAGASASTFSDVVFCRFEPDFNFRRSTHGYGAGTLHVWVAGYGHTGTTRLAATAAGTGIFLSVPIASVAGDAPALLDTTITAGAFAPSLGRIVAVAPITQPSYTPQIGAASLTDLQAGATVIGASGADGSQYLALPVSPTGGASGVACKVPLPNPTIAGGDNRILAVVKSGIDAGVGITALDPYGNAMGATAVASMSAGFGLVDLGVCRLPTVGYPTQPKISIMAGALWASGAAGPAILASPAGLALNEILCLPDKNLTLIMEGVNAAGPFSKDSFRGAGGLNGRNDDLGNPWSAAWNNTSPTPILVVIANSNEVGLQSLAASTVDSSHLAGVLADSMLISAKVSPGNFGVLDTRLTKERASGAYLQARLAFGGSTTATQALDLAAATNGTLNTIASLGLATLSGAQFYRLALQTQGPQAFVTLSRDDGGPVFTPGSAAFASIGVASNAAVAGAGVPGFTLFKASSVQFPALKSWEVDPLPVSGSALTSPFDSYRIDGVNSDSYRQSSAGVFAGQKLVSVQRGAFTKLQPSTTSVAVICAPFDQGVANDIVSAQIAVRERFSYAR